MFNSLSDRLQDTFDKLRGKGRLTEDDINLAMREIRMALLEADVNFRVVKQFVGRCKEKCMASEVLDSLTPSTSSRSFWAPPSPSWSWPRTARPTSS